MNKNENLLILLLSYLLYGSSDSRDQSRCCHYLDSKHWGGFLRRRRHSLLYLGSLELRCRHSLLRLDWGRILSRCRRHSLLRGSRILSRCWRISRLLRGSHILRLSHLCWRISRLLKWGSRILLLSHRCWRIRHRRRRLNRLWLSYLHRHRSRSLHHCDRCRCSHSNRLIRHWRHCLDHFADARNATKNPGKHVEWTLSLNSHSFRGRRQSDCDNRL